jgi:urea transport system substrate-binding protein
MWCLSIPRLPSGALWASLILGLLPVPALGAAQTEPIKVGVLHSLSGTMAMSERPLVDAVHLAIDEINARGGVLGRALVPVIEDGASDPATFRRKAEKLIVQDGVRTVLGCWTSASRKAVVPVVEKHHHLLWYPVQYEGCESSPHVIYTGAVPNQQLLPAVDWCLEHCGKRVFLVGSDYVFPRTANTIIKAQLRKRGAACVGEEYRPLGDTDFARIVAKIQSIRPDFVFNTINGDSNVAFFKAYWTAGLRATEAPIMSVSLAEVEVLSLDPRWSEGHYCAWNYFQSLDTPANHRFVKAFQKRFGKKRVTDDPIAAAYLQVHLYARAVARAGSTECAAVRQAARGLIFPGPGGLVRIDPGSQHTWKVARIGQIDDRGQLKIVWSSEEPIRAEPYPDVLFPRSPAAVPEKGATKP